MTQNVSYYMQIGLTAIILKTSNTKVNLRGQIISPIAEKLDDTNAPLYCKSLS